MTTIIGAKFNDKIIVGADSLVTSDSSKYLPSAGFSKLIRFPNYIVGFAGGVSAYHILKSYLKKPKIKARRLNTAEDVFSFSRMFYKDLKKFYDSCITFNSGSDKTLVNDLLIASKAGLFSVTEFHVEVIDKFVCVGSGEDAGRAALMALYPNANCVKRALDIACEIDLQSGGKIDLLEIKL